MKNIFHDLNVCTGFVKLRYNEELTVEAKNELEYPGRFSMVTFKPNVIYRYAEGDNRFFSAPNRVYNGIYVACFTDYLLHKYFDYIGTQKKGS